MIIEVCIFLIALICTFITISYAYIFYYQRRILSSWRKLRDLYNLKYELCLKVADIALLTYSNDSEVIKALNESIDRFAKVISPEEYSHADKRMVFTLTKMVKLMEKYPLLYENDKYTELNDSLIILDEKIAFSRQFYNKEISSYNTKVFRLPVRIVSSIFNFRKKNVI